MPNCPRCGGPNMERVLSRFAVARSGKSTARDSGIGDETDRGPAEKEHDELDDPFARLAPTQREHAEREMFRLMGDAESLDERDPRQLGAFLRRMTAIVGDDGGPEMREAIRRLEAGEDPEKLEEEYGDLLGLGEEGGTRGGDYSYDSDLYDL